MRYVPQPLNSLVGVEAELRRVGEHIDNMDPVFQTYHAEPDKPFEGLTVLADGTDWDPGSGKGVYTYYSSTWNKLG